MRLIKENDWSGVDQNFAELEDRINQLKKELTRLATIVATLNSQLRK